MTLPRLTTMNVDRGMLGREAYRLMQLRIAEPDATARKVEIGVTFVEGGTLASKARPASERTAP